MTFDQYLGWLWMQLKVSAVGFVVLVIILLVGLWLKRRKK